MTVTPQMYTLGRLYGSENPTASGVIGAGDLRKDAMMYSANALSLKLSDAKGDKFEAELPILLFP